MVAFLAGVVTGAIGLYLALWFDMGMDWLDRFWED